MDRVTQLIIWLKTWPLWVWIIIPLLLFMWFCFAITRNRRLTLSLTALASGLILFTVAFQHWEVYLSQHFVGAFDKYGIPNDITKSGWQLLIEAWPIWAFPTALALVIGTLLGLGYGYLNQPSAGQHTPHSSDAPSPEDNNLLIAKQLEIQRLRSEIEHYKKQAQQSGIALDQLQNKKPRAQAANSDENTQLKQQIAVLNRDLTHARKLIKELLDDHYRSDNSAD